MHKYDQGAYTILLFDLKGRKTGEAYAQTLVDADDLGREHEAQGGSYVVTRAIKNSADSALWMPKK